MSFLENLGVPTVAIVQESFVLDYKAEATKKTFPALRIVVTPLLAGTPSEPESEKAKCVTAAEEMVDELIKVSTGPLTPEEKKSAAAEVVKLPRIAFTGTVQEVNDFFYEQGWTDGLPIIPPAEEAVKEMLTGTDLAPDYLVAKMLPRDALVTVEKIAISAVMAGCVPTHMPVLIAAVEILADDTLCILEGGVSTGGYATVEVINGPIRKDLDLRVGTGLMSPGRRSNSAIGRAVSLMKVVVGGARVAIENMGAMGNPALYSCCFGEYEEKLAGWSPLHVEQGFKKEQNVLTMWIMNAFIVVVGDTADKFLDVCGQNIPSGYSSQDKHPRLGTWVPWPIIIGKDTAARLVEAGYTKETAAKRIYEESFIPVEQWLKLGVGSGKWPDFLDKTLPIEEAIKKAGVTSLPKVTGGPETICFIVGGGAQPKSCVHRVSRSMLTSKEIKLPKNWPELVTKYKDAKLILTPEVDMIT